MLWNVASQLYRLQKTVFVLRIVFFFLGKWAAVSVPHSISALLIGASCGWFLAAWSLLSLPLAVLVQPVPLIRCLCFMFAAVYNAAKKSCSRLSNDWESATVAKLWVDLKEVPRGEKCFYIVFLFASRQYRLAIRIIRLEWQQISCVYEWRSFVRSAASAGMSCLPLYLVLIAQTVCPVSIFCVWIQTESAKVMQELDHALAAPWGGQGERHVCCSLPGH